MFQQICFGMISSKVSTWLKFARRIVCICLRNHKDAKVRMPTAEEIERHKKITGEKHPLLKDVYGAMDGLKIRMQESTQPDVQLLFYNGYVDRV